MRKTLLRIILCATVSAWIPTYAQSTETTPENDAKMQWWRNAKFGMFIHWGVYSVPAGIYKGEKIPAYSEWIMLNAKIPVDDYRSFASEFNPTKYDPQAWVNLAEEAGMKYMVITTKHHDGFALFDSEASDWNAVKATPYGKDLLKPLVEAAKKEDMPLGFYYSQSQDWVNPGGAMRKVEGPWDEAQKGDYVEYLKNIAVPQVRELLTKYGDVRVLWWDTPTEMKPHNSDLFNFVKDLQPGIIENDRLAGGRSRGDYKTPEQHVPEAGYPGDWETCMTLNGSWGYKSYDTRWKSTKVLLTNLIDIVSKGGNYLLNVGPTPEGEIPEESVKLLKEIGAWMKINGDSIYGTIASPCKLPEWGRITTKTREGRTTLFLHVLDWPDDGKLFLPVHNSVKSCHLLADPERPVEASTSSKGITLQLNGTAPDPIASVIELELDGVPAVNPSDKLPQQSE